MKHLFFAIASICGFSSKAQHISIGINSGISLNQVWYYNPNLDQNRILCNLKQAAEVCLAYEFKSGLRQIGFFTSYNPSQNMTTISGAPLFPLGKAFGHQRINFSFMRYGLSLKQKMLGNGRYKMICSVDAGFNVLNWNSFSPNQIGNSSQMFLGGYDNFLDFDYYTRHRKNSTFFMGMGVGVYRTLGKRFSVGTEISYRFGFKPLTVMITEYTLYQYSRQNPGLYAYGIGSNFGNALRGSLGLSYILFNKRKNSVIENK